MATIPAPSVEDLLPPFLAHIPIAFSSTQPPPSLLPLLAPILRSRVRLLSGFTPDSWTTTPSDSWLSHLTWSSTGAELSLHLSQQDFSPHPTGEFEIGEYKFKGIRRFDKETLKTRVELLERGTEVIYVWVAESEDKGEGEGWKIVDVRLSRELKEDEEGTWYPTIASAEEAFRKDQEQKYKTKTEPVKEAFFTSPPTTAAELASSYLSPPSSSFPAPRDDENDDSYWDMYDRSPARTPAVEHQTHIQSEDEYFARYANIQPALDRGEGEEEMVQPPSRHNSYNTATTLPPPQTHPTYNPPTSATATTTTTTFPPQPPQQQSTFHPTHPLSPPTSSPSKPPTQPTTPPLVSTDPEREIKTPSPRSGSGSPSAGISVMEDLANQQMQVEMGVRQHISTSLKSLFRLARVSGMGREEYERVVRTELEVLGLVEEAEGEI